MKPGIYDSISIDAYARDPCEEPSLSSGIAHLLLTRSPKHAYIAHPKLNKAWRQDEDSRFDVGSAAHAVLLENALDRIQVLDFPDWRKKEAKELRAIARLEGKIPLLVHQAANVVGMVMEATRFLLDSEIGNVMADGKAEQTVVWQEGDTWCRCRPDWIANDGAVLSYKTTGNAEPGQWIDYVALRSGYEIQAGWEMRGLANPGAPYYWLVQETEAPYACMLAGMTPQLLQHASDKIVRALSIWRECISTGNWPGYSNRVHYAEPQAWDVARWQERMSMEAMEAER